MCIRDRYIKEKKEKITRSDNHAVYIDFIALQREQEPLIILYELIKEYLFNYEQAKEILSTHTERTGKKFLSSSHVLLINRTDLIITNNNAFNISTIEIQQDTKEISVNGQTLHFTKKMIDNIPLSSSTACLKLQNLSFPLSLQKWEHGDFFYPLGMKQKKNLSDFFIDIKLPMHLKEKAMTLKSGNDIVWVVGYRIDERYKINKGEECFFVEITDQQN